MRGERRNESEHRKEEPEAHCRHDRAKSHESGCKSYIIFAEYVSHRACRLNEAKHWTGRPGSPCRQEIAHDRSPGCLSCPSCPPFLPHRRCPIPLEFPYHSITFSTSQRSLSSVCHRHCGEQHTKVHPSHFANPHDHRAGEHRIQEHAAIIFSICYRHTTESWPLSKTADSFEMCMQTRGYARLEADLRALFSRGTFFKHPFLSRIHTDTSVTGTE